MTSNTFLVYVDSAGGVNGLYGHGLASAMREFHSEVRAVCPWDNEHERHPAVELDYLGPMPGRFRRKLPPILIRLWRLARVWFASPRDARVIVAICGHLEALVLGLILKIRRPRLGSCLVVHDPVPHRWFLPISLRGFETWVAQRAFRLFDQIVVHTDTGRLRLLESGICAERIFLCVLPTIRPPVGDRNWTNRAGVVMVGSMRPDKDYIGVVQAFQELDLGMRRAHPLTIAGRPMKGFDLDALRREIERDPVGIKLLAGFVAHDRYSALLVEARVCVVPYVEPVSVSAVAMEAADHGCVPAMPLVGSLVEVSHTIGGLVWPDSHDDRVQTLQESLASGRSPRIRQVSTSFRELARLCAGRAASENPVA